ncbi:MAG TPA: hypothetical protein VGS22_21290 [Thermoanaerobaculia bacterium]|nr:hypothetical protein [Thermoanaerobaculia bacterium]
MSSRLALILPVLLAGCPQTPDLTLTLQLHKDAALPVAVALKETCDTLRRRLDQLDVQPAVVEPAGSERILVKISHKDDSPQVRRALLASVVFELRFVRQPADGAVLSSQDEVLARYDGKLPPEVEILPAEIRGEKYAKGTQYFAVDRRAVLTGRDIRSARTGLGSLGEPVVEFSVKPEPAKALYQATGANVGSLLAIVLDGHVISAPRLNTRIGESGVIEGGFTEQEARDLAVALSSGPLPGRLTLVEESSETSKR